MFLLSSAHSFSLATHSFYPYFVTALSLLPFPTLFFVTPQPLSFLFDSLLFIYTGIALPLEPSHHSYLSFHPVSPILSSHVAIPPPIYVTSKRGEIVRGENWTQGQVKKKVNGNESLDYPVYGLFRVVEGNGRTEAGGKRRARRVSWIAGPPPPAGSRPRPAPPRS